MNIGFDLDKVFVNYPPVIPNWLIDKLYKEKDNGILLYRIPGKFEQLIRQISHFSLFRPAILENIAFLTSLSQIKKYHLYLISSRFSFLHSQTTRITHLYKLDQLFKEMFFNYKDQQPHEFKDKIIKTMKIDLYVDDDFSLIKYLAKNNPKVIFLWLSYRKTAKLTKNIFAITKLSEVSQYL